LASRRQQHKSCPRLPGTDPLGPYETSQAKKGIAVPEAKVLCVSFDSTVSDNRCATLKEAGYDAVASTNIPEALEFLAREKFDAVIIGHRFSREEKYVLAVEAKEKSGTPVLLVCGGAHESEIPATVRIYALEGSAGLLPALSALISKVQGTPSQAA